MRSFERAAREACHELVCDALFFRKGLGPPRGRLRRSVRTLCSASAWQVACLWPRLWIRTRSSGRPESLQPYYLSVGKISLYIEGRGSPPCQKPFARPRPRSMSIKALVQLGSDETARPRGSGPSSARIARPRALGLEARSCGRFVMRPQAHRCAGALHRQPWLPPPEGRSLSRKLE